MRIAALAFAILAIAIALLFARPHPTPGPIMRDFEAYYAAGATLRSGQDPYGAAIWIAEHSIPGVDERHYELLPFVSPPTTLAVFVPLSLLPYGAATLIWGCVLGVATMILLLASLGLARRRISWLALACMVALALGFGAITSDLALGGIAIIAAATAALGALAMERGRTWLAGVSWWFALLQPNLALPPIVYLRSVRGIALVGAVIVFVGIGAWFAVLLPWLPGPGAYVWILAQHSGAERFALIQHTPAAIAYGLGASPIVAITVAIACALAAVAAWIAIASCRATVLGFAAGCALLAWIVPFFHEHDFTIAFPALIVAMRPGLQRSTALTARIALVLIAVDWLGLAQRPDGAMQSALLICAALAAAQALEPIRWRDTIALAVATVAAIALGWLAVHNAPAPIWPDAMRAFSVSPGASAAEIWRLEQDSAGMFARNVVWAALRALPLIGCALLAICLHPSCCRTTLSDSGGSS